MEIFLRKLWLKQKLARKQKIRNPVKRFTCNINYLHPGTLPAPWPLWMPCSFRVYQYSFRVQCSYMPSLLHAAPEVVDYHMVENVYAHYLPCLYQLLCDLYILAARCGIRKHIYVLLFCSSITSSIRRLRYMAEYGEWNRKGATLSDVTAQKEYGVSRDFIVEGIRAGKLEYREGKLTSQYPDIRITPNRSESLIYIPCNYS